MTRRIHVNNFQTTLATTISSSATSVVISSATGLPVLGAGEVYRLTIAQSGRREIMEVTARTGTTLTVTRAQESTTAQAFTAGATIELRATANSIDRKADLVSTSGDVLNFGDATSLEIPNNATASLTAEGQIALDTSVTDFADGVVCYRAGSTDYGVVAIPKTDLASPTNNYVVTYDSATDKFKLASPSAGVGDVVGPGSSTDNAITRFDSTTGKLIQNSGALLDDNNNIYANNLAPSYTTTATAAGTTTLTSASTGIQYFTGTTTQTVVLPVTSTLTQGHTFLIYNLSTGNVTVNSSGGNAVVVVAAGMYAILHCILTSGTTAASWEYIGTAGPSAGATQSTDRILLLDASNSFRLSYTTVNSINQVGTIGSGSWQATAVGVLYGGTGLTSLSQGDLLYGSASNTFSKLIKNTSATRYLANTGTNNNPAWDQVNLANGVTGILPPANGGAMTTNTASGTTQSAAVNNAYICTNAAQCNVTLPAVAAVGDLVKVVSQGAGGIKVTANTGQTIKGLGNTTTSAGSITPAAQYDTIQVICVVANTTWVIDHYASTLLTFA